MPLRTAVDGETPRPGTVYFPQEDTHLVLDRQGRLQASREPPVDGHRPSATVTFRSVAERYGRAAVAVLLSGMGRDGGAGMADVLRAGGVTVAQDEASCVVWGMPRAAVELGVARLVLPPSEIARLLVEAIRPRPG